MANARPWSCSSKTAPWPERVRLALEGLLCALARHPDGARVVFVEMLGAGPAACERHREALALFAALIEEGRLLRADSAAPAEADLGGDRRRHRLDRASARAAGETAELPALHADLTYFALLPYLDHERALSVARVSSP